jgi:hypothetical protein
MPIQTTAEEKALNTIEEHRSMDPPARIAAIGELNLSLLRQIKQAGRLPHRDLVARSREFGYRTADEAVYRVLFLEAIALVDEEHEGGHKLYVLSSVIAAIPF